MGIVLENVCKSIKGVEILHQVSFELSKGIYGLLGPNGAGKTTLMRCMAGVYEIDGGSMHIDKETKDGMGYLPQKFGFHGNLTVYENLEYLAVLKKVKTENLREHILSCIDTVHLTDKKDLKCKKLSGGMLQRLGIAQTLLGKPKCIILDEPTVGLDPEERLRIKQLLGRIGQETILLISTHIVEDLENLCDEILVMNEGSVLRQSSRDELLQEAERRIYQIPAAWEEQIQGEFVILRTLQKNGEEYYRIACRDEQSLEYEKNVTLEDAYICTLKGYARDIK
ncbi:MAG: ATP-binding cassette domain-containing protein [Lachnospiraceae bacterium]|nr:ATP-binding cassette domain-containing protein [Lachnospiraceae bacterium]